MVLFLKGTFEAENEEVVYGLTHPLNTFDPNYVQVNKITTFQSKREILN